jgi:hypothetical protein
MIRTRSPRTSQPLGHHGIGAPSDSSSTLGAGPRFQSERAIQYCNLAVLLERRGDLAGAERHLRQAAEGGDTLAAAALRDLPED